MNKFNYDNRHSKPLVEGNQRELIYAGGFNAGRSVISNASTTSSICVSKAAISDHEYALRKNRIQASRKFFSQKSHKGAAKSKKQ